MGLSKLAVNQVMAAMIQNHPLNSKHIIPQHSSPPIWTSQSVSMVLKSVLKFFFKSPNSIKVRKGSIIIGPAAYTDPHKVNLGLNKAMEFFYWVENNFEFTHDKITCRDMACLLAQGSYVKTLWGFLEEMSRREVSGLVTVKTVTCLIKVLGKIGLADEALAMFYRMKMFHCQPDVYTYNAVIYALCRVGNFTKARILFEQMELPGFWCPPNKFTYTILIRAYCKSALQAGWCKKEISAYCKSALQTGCKKEIRRRLWEADQLFRIMVSKGFNPDVATYNCLIDGCCKSYWILRAFELFYDMVERGCRPDHVTYDSFIKFFLHNNEIDKALEVFHDMPTLGDRSFTPIINALCEAGRVIEARDVLDHWIHQGNLPPEYAYRLVQNMLKLTGQFGFLDNGWIGGYEDEIEYHYNEYKRVMKAQHPGEIGFL